MDNYSYNLFAAMQTSISDNEDSTQHHIRATCMDVGVTQVLPWVGDNNQSDLQLELHSDCPLTNVRLLSAIYSKEESGPRTMVLFAMGQTPEALTVLPACKSVITLHSIDDEGNCSDSLFIPDVTQPGRFKRHNVILYQQAPVTFPYVWLNHGPIDVKVSWAKTHLLHFSVHLEGVHYTGHQFVPNNHPWRGLDPNIFTVSFYAGCPVLAMKTDNTPNPKAIG